MSTRSRTRSRVNVNAARLFCLVLLLATWSLFYIRLGRAPRSGTIIGRLHY